VQFLPHDAMQAWPMPSCGVCVSVHLSVHPSVCLSRLYIQSKCINKSSKFFSVRYPRHYSFSIPNIVAVFRWEPLALKAGGVGRNNDSEPISGFITCCQCCNWLGVINTTLPDHGPLLLTVSSAVC